MAGRAAATTYNIYTPPHIFTILYYATVRHISVIYVVVRTDVDSFLRWRNINNLILYYNKWLRYSSTSATVCKVSIIINICIKYTVPYGIIAYVLYSVSSVATYHTCKNSIHVLSISSTASRKILLLCIRICRAIVILRAYFVWPSWLSLVSHCCLLCFRV